MESKRCPWAKTQADIVYHDTAWGKPVHDDGLLFEMLILEGMQAGLSWNTILNKREAMRTAFDGFDPRKIARYDDNKLAELVLDKGIIRNKAKLNALVRNARAFLSTQQEYQTFDRYIWSFVENSPIVNAWTDASQVPAQTALSARMSKELLKRGFKFVGPTICYAFMQAIGMVNDHLVWCDQYHNC